MTLLQRSIVPVLLLLGGQAAPAGDWQAAVNGNLQFDSNRFDEEDSSYALSGVRRSRLAVSVKAPAGFDAKAEFDVHANVWTDAYVRWKSAAGHSVRVGQYKQPMYQDELTSDKATTFIEPAAPGSLGIARRLGAEYSYVAKQWRIAVSAYDGNLAGKLQGSGLAARAVWTPLAEPGRLLHLAVAVADEDPADGRARFSSRVEAANFAPTRLDTGTLTGVDGIRRSGIEGIWIHGPFSVQAEYLRANVERNSASSSLDGWYAQASWFPTGEHRGYKDGSIDLPALGEDGRALELALRVSELDLDDAAIAGGHSTQWTAGATWYVNNHVRILGNWVHVDGTRRAVGISPNILEGRVQVVF